MSTVDRSKWERLALRAATGAVIGAAAFGVGALLIYSTGQFGRPTVPSVTSVGAGMGAVLGPTVGGKATRVSLLLWPLVAVGVLLFAAVRNLAVIAAQGMEYGPFLTALVGLVVSGLLAGWLTPLACRKMMIA